MDSGKLDAALASQLVQELLAAVEYCHRKGLANLELNIDSIFLSDTGRFKLKTLRTCMKGDKFLPDGCDTQELLEFKTKDMDAFCELVTELMSRDTVRTTMREHAHLLKSLYGFILGEHSFAEFCKTCK